MSNLGLPVTDGYGRRLRYLRMSITDRCNLKCVYCVNTSRQRFIPHDRILRYEELLRLAAVFWRMGVGKFRITGGEPFARKGAVEFLARFRAAMPNARLAVTTNAILASGCLNDIAVLGLDSVNIYLDSFDAATYRDLTGVDALERVVWSIERLLSLGQTVKINAVAINGITDLQMDSFIYAIRHMPVDLRFIEYMPIGGNTAWTDDRFISAENLKRVAAGFAKLDPLASDDVLAGPARMYRVAGAKGRIGFISALTHHFCGVCQRMRLTSEGNLRPCLFADSEIRLGPLLRNSRFDDERLARVITAAYARKPLGTDCLANKRRNSVVGKQMVGIGG